VRVQAETAVLGLNALTARLAGQTEKCNDVEFKVNDLTKAHNAQVSNLSTLEQQVNRQDRCVATHTPDKASLLGCATHMHPVRWWWSRCVSTVAAAAATPFFRDLTDGALHKSIEQLRAAAKRSDGDVEELQARVGDTQEQMMRVKMSWVNMHGHLQQVEHAVRSAAPQLWVCLLLTLLLSLSSEQAWFGELLPTPKKGWIRAYPLGDGVKSTKHETDALKFRTRLKPLLVSTN
jgi:hypothetical protein